MDISSVHVSLDQLEIPNLVPRSSNSHIWVQLKHTQDHTQGFGVSVIAYCVLRAGPA